MKGRLAHLCNPETAVVCEQRVAERARFVSMITQVQRKGATAVPVHEVSSNGAIYDGAIYDGALYDGAI